MKKVSEIVFCFIFTTGFVRIVIKNWFKEKILVPIFIVTIFISIIAVAIFVTLSFLLLLSPWLSWCSSCHYYWCWCDCRRYFCPFCNIVVIIASLFSILIMYHHCFQCFTVTVFSLSFLMPLLLHIVFCYCYHYSCMGVVVIIGVRVLVAIIIIVLIIFLLLILHHCFVIFFNSFLISLNLSSH